MRLAPPRRPCGVPCRWPGVVPCRARGWPTAALCDPWRRSGGPSVGSFFGAGSAGGAVRRWRSTPRRGDPCRGAARRTGTGEGVTSPAGDVMAPASLGHPEGPARGVTRTTEWPESAKWVHRMAPPRYLPRGVRRSVPSCARRALRRAVRPAAALRTLGQANPGAGSRGRRCTALLQHPRRGDHVPRCRRDGTGQPRPPRRCPPRGVRRSVPYVTSHARPASAAAQRRQKD